ncbi:MAG: hypothetical protein Q7R22_010420, partial [Verrucomicrobiota bacterium JB025]|nr:hypothetical protein [Verrucomicrobiota bacterium JB025]
AFSFEGQNVEYRFNPDGTWEETKLENPPDDGPGSRAEAAERRKAAAVPEAGKEGKDAEEVSRLPWIVAGGIGLLVLAFLGKMVLGKGGTANERE